MSPSLYGALVRFLIESDNPILRRPENPGAPTLLGFPDNPPEGAIVRLHKHLSAKASGVYAIPTHALTDVEEAIHWISQLEIGNGECVIKPVEGLFGDRVEYGSTKNPEALRNLLTTLLTTNRPFIVQPRIRGRKFYANTFTIGGVTKIVSAAEYFHIEYDRKPNYCFSGVLSSDSPEVSWMQAALDVLIPSHNITFGMSHPEFILDDQTGKLYLLEMNGRVAGVGLPRVDAEVYGVSQLHLHILGLLDSDRFAKEFAKLPRPRKKSAFLFVVSSPGRGVWNRSAIETLRSNASYFLPSPLYEKAPEGAVNATVGMNSPAGIFYFVGSREDVRRDLLRTIDLFESGELIDHTKIVDESGAFDEQACSKTLAEIGHRKTELSGSMRRAFEEIDWERF